ncbi:hypothetical protein TIFTF001_056321 [Ficus carica]|uniref:Uncharacterized protein n=1 Tax=Ficus carica TaxID=3494 RepID=A0AA88EQ56_FICCA|nr:hypothetical protein TIFTF001_056321 [Ficus carica]
MDGSLDARHRLPASKFGLYAHSAVGFLVVVVAAAAAAAAMW